MSQPAGLPAPLEKEIQRYFVDLLAAFKIINWRYSVTALRHTSKGKEFFRKNPLAGFPDICGLTPKGRFWAAEIKTLKGQVSENQQHWITTLDRGGALVKVIRSLEEAKDFLFYILTL